MKRSWVIQCARIITCALLLAGVFAVLLGSINAAILYLSVRSRLSPNGECGVYRAEGNGAVYAGNGARFYKDTYLGHMTYQGKGISFGKGSFLATFLTWTSEVSSKSSGDIIDAEHAFAEKLREELRTGMFISTRAYTPNAMDDRLVCVPALRIAIVYNKRQARRQVAATTAASLMVMGGLGVGRFAWKRYRRHKRLGHGKCVKCGYELSITSRSSSVCPECGCRDQNRDAV